MLDDLSDDTDKAKDTLEMVTKKTQELIKQSGADPILGDLLMGSGV
jgi:hypothetical protein